MTTRDFCFWLQGHFEMNKDDNKLSEEQIKVIKEHLNLVFKHEAKQQSVAYTSPEVTRPFGDFEATFC